MVKMTDEAKFVSKELRVKISNCPLVNNVLSEVVTILREGEVNSKLDMIISTRDRYISSLQRELMIVEYYDGKPITLDSNIRCWLKNVANFCSLRRAGINTMNEFVEFISANNILPERMNERRLESLLKEYRISALLTGRESNEVDSEVELIENKISILMQEGK